MKRKSPIRTSRILIAIFFYGSIVGFTSGEKDGNEKTWIDIAAGIGSFTQVIRDCNNNVLRHDDYPFIDGGITLRHTYNNLSFTGKLGAFHSIRNTIYLSPNYDSLSDASDNRSYTTTFAGAAIGVNFPYFGLDLGVLYFDHIQSGYFPVNNSKIQPMGKLRIGFEDSWYFSTSLLYNNTFISQGGLFDMGLGFRISGTQSSIWSGIGGAPYSGAQFIVRTIITPDHWKAAILLSGNFGLSSDGTEYGLSAGIRLNLQ